MKDRNRIEARVFIGNTLALTAAVAFAFTNTSASLAFQGGSNPLTLAAIRFVLPALVLMVWLTAQGWSVWLPKRDAWIAVGLGALTAGYSWALLSAIGAIPLALAILIFYLFPLVATGILVLFGWETLGWKTIAAIIGTASARAAKAATTTVPVVFMTGDDPGKPPVRSDSGLVVLNAGTDTEMDAAFTALVQQRAGAVLSSGSLFLGSRRDRQIVLAARHAVPVFC